MIRTIIWYTFFWLYQVVSLVLFIPLLVLRLAGMKQREAALAHYFVRSWARQMIGAAGAVVTVRGLSNIPAHGKYCIVANHQGGFDIPLLLGYMPKIAGFIAKKELKYVPIMSGWMREIHCVFLDRSNRRAASTAIAQAVEQVQNGHPLIIFPEGTRSRSGRMNTFKPGSLKLPIRAKALIIPVTIDGSYLLKEANGGLMRPGNVTITVHPSVDATPFSESQTQELAERLSGIIQSGFISPETK
ncbi:MAG: 1-acyl-sn-glycerol-3-phosphate acyltransferase [Desulfofustis sp. PB-SRB1]|jgi:1-acyl-sn-glycerol-3-phosphate acyltransferase|nr:1-acyl-sn-glycerol-3-phosphate acyltransferase [Desulfofustis sp. PB-SRB1]MBM1002272.1 1-acyl-sn-glycerol-3-phosphate acyltransferase [Desulfofustis sp. PB-SRB1]HBH29569.1 1-acyl-sn-glycerol-3-phosphate acyltransferase [Desulfofustis sp.]HBH32430.1 1-acyl-sn-glycerol-3-phosphate acyltransferase [Desulfofustis sp.]